MGLRPIQDSRRDIRCLLLAEDAPFQTRLNQGLVSVRLLLFILGAQLSLFQYLDKLLRPAWTRGRVESWRGNPIEQPLSVSGVAPFVPG